MVALLASPLSSVLAGEGPYRLEAYLKLNRVRTI